MGRHFAAEALLRGVNGCAGRGGFVLLFCLGFFLGFLSGFFLGLFRGLPAGHGTVDGLQGGVGGDRRAGQRFDPVLTVGEGSALADELAGERLLGRPLAQAGGLVGRIDRQRLDLAAVQGHMGRHFAAEALFRGVNGIAGCGGFALLFCLGFFLGLLSGFLLRFFLCLFRGILTGHGAVDGFQGRVGGDRRAAQRLDPVLAERKGTALADELAGECLLGRPFSKAFRLVRRINGQFLHLVPVQGDLNGNVAAEAFFSSFRRDSAGRQVLRGRIVYQGFFPAEYACDRQDNHADQHRAHRDPDPLLLFKIIHVLPSLSLTRGWS